MKTDVRVHLCTRCTQTQEHFLCNYTKEIEYMCDRALRL